MTREFTEFLPPISLLNIPETNVGPCQGSRAPRCSLFHESHVFRELLTDSLQSSCLDRMRPHELLAPVAMLTQQATAKLSQHAELLRKHGQHLSFHSFASQLVLPVRFLFLLKAEVDSPKPPSPWKWDLGGSGYYITILRVDLISSLWNYVKLGEVIESGKSHFKIFSGTITWESSIWKINLVCIF